MAFEGYQEYPKRAYCRAVNCPVQVLLEQEEPGSDRYNQIRRVCQEGCLQTSHAFHAWLIKEGYIIIRPQKLQ